MKYSEVKKKIKDNLYRLTIDKAYEKKNGEIKMNLKKSIYTDILLRANIITADKEQVVLKPKQELFKEAKKLGLNPKWTESTKISLNRSINEHIATPILSTNEEIDDFFKKRELDTEINISSSDIINYIGYIPFDKDVLLRIAILKNNEMNYKILSNRDNLFKLLDNINKGVKIEDIEKRGSDIELMQYAVVYGGSIELAWVKNDALFNRNSGQYMPYYNNLIKLDLSRYQFYHRWQKRNNEACFLYAVRMFGIPDEELDRIKFIIVKDSLNTNDIKTIAKMLKIRVSLTYYDEKQKKKRIIIYNKSSKNNVNIGLINKHYFINELTTITYDAISKYDECCEFDLFPSCRVVNIKDKKYILKPKDKNPYLNSYDVILNIIKYKHITPISMFNHPHNNTEKLIEYEKLREPYEAEDENSRSTEVKRYDELKRRFMLESSKEIEYDEDKKEFVYIKTNKKVEFDVIFADFETFIDEELGYHIPYCVSYAYIDSPKIHSIYGLDCALEFLEKITKQSVIITHNLGFDFKMLQDSLHNLRECIQTGTQLKTIKATYGQHKLIFKDNCAFLAGKLSSLPENFKLKCGDKEAFPYSLINHENFDKLIPMGICLKHLDKKKHKIFKENSESFTTSDVVDIKGYSIKYCEQDVRILKEAFCCFRQQILDISDNFIDIIHNISLPQVADDYFRLKKCFDGCFKFSGIAHDFIRRCIVGGRVMCKDNKKNHVKKLVEDFDAVSLYPSAMSRLRGYLKGKPKVIYDFEPALYDHYFIEIKINKLGIKRGFPLVSIKTDEGIHNFTNDIVGKNIYVDKTTLEDLIKWQKIEYTFIRGYYFDDGFNPTIKKVIKEVFEERKKLKAVGNSLQETYKLIMNSSYGKLCQKPIKRKIIFKERDDKKFNNFIVNNYENIVEYTHINDNLTKIVIEKSINEHFAPVHMACQVLSMSKRIMNKVMTLAEDNDINVYYQDTDSMHIDSDQINKLSELFKKEYNRNLIGSNMGQFHSDFGVFDDEGKKIKEAENIVACESIFLGKKCYLDKLRYNLKGFEEYLYSYHKRMKGVAPDAITDVGEPLETYMTLYEGEPVTFDLAPYCVMQATKGLRMIKREAFLRVLKF